MKRFITPLILLIVAILAQTSFAADSANKIIDRYKKASGGGAIKRVKSTSMSGTVKGADGAEGRFVYRVAGPDRLRTDIDVEGFKVSECYNGKSAWRMDGRGLRTLLGAEAKRLRLEALVANSRLQELSRNRIIAEPPSKATVEGREANAIELSKDDARVKIFFDAKTNLPVKQERERAEGLEEIFYGDYRAVDGVMEPFSIRIKNGAGELTVALDRVAHNASVDDTAFRHPQVEGARPLPDLETLFKAVIANQEKVEEMRERYSFRASETERKLEKDGRVKETETKVYDVTPVAGSFVERLISVNGKELTPAEREKEDRRVEKDVEEALKRREKRLKKEAQARERGKKEEEEDDDITILDFLRISEVTSVRREIFRGHEVIAFDFEPRKGFKPKNRAETIVSKLAGTTWVDENARQIVRLEARLTNSFKMGGGLLASISPSSAFAFEQEKVGDELWLPSYGEANISARIMLFAKFNRSMERRYSDYKKYQIDSDYELAKPKENTKPDSQP
ncbi:MAG TPA: hypothetical protein VKA70_06335 [Blastocatellia bacterium]|nr:hypothetical protein [Blastocatellia bacterium]